MLNQRIGGSIGAGEYAGQGMLAPMNNFVDATGTLTPVSFRFLHSLFRCIQDLEEEVAALTYGAWAPVGLVAGVQVLPPGGGAAVPLVSTGQVLVRVQGTPRTLQIAGRFDFSPSITADARIGTLPAGVAVATSIAFGVAARLQSKGGGLGNAVIRLDPDGSINLLPPANDQVLGVAFAQTVPLQ